MHRSGLFSGFKNPSGLSSLFRKDALQRKSDPSPQPNAKLEINSSSGATRSVAAGALPAASVVTHMQASGSSNQFSSVENGILLNNNEHVANLEASSDLELNAIPARPSANKLQDTNFNEALNLRHPITANGKALRAIARVTDASGQRVLGLIQFDQVIMCFSMQSFH